VDVTGCSGGVSLLLAGLRADHGVWSWVWTCSTLIYWKRYNKRRLQRREGSILIHCGRSPTAACGQYPARLVCGSGRSFGGALYVRVACVPHRYICGKGTATAVPALPLLWCLPAWISTGHISVHVVTRLSKPGVSMAQVTAGALKHAADLMAAGTGIARKTGWRNLVTTGWRCVGGGKRDGLAFFPSGKRRRGRQNCRPEKRLNSRLLVGGGRTNSAPFAVLLCTTGRSGSSLL